MCVVCGVVGWVLVVLRGGLLGVVLCWGCLGVGGGCVGGCGVVCAAGEGVCGL